MKRSPKSNFYPELQGLRAIAVLIVVLFHVNPNWLPGGYVGVDVFFVISGFVITASLMREATKSDLINIPMFYVRRVRRLLPVAAVVLLFVIIGTYLLLPQGQWSQIGFEVIASAFYFENWALFADATNYLAQDEADSPIVHYWSLSIEEQFYFIWPILIFLVIKFSSAASRAKSLLILLCLIFFTSLAFSVIFTHQAPQQGYFSSLTRIWELALGAILAILIWRPKVALGNIFTVCGITMIIAASFYYSESSVFPGYLALLPTLGAAMIIMAATNGQKLHALAPLRSALALFTGNISYSLYLWHWPFIVFGLAIFGGDASPIERIFLIAISFVVARVSTHLLEDPFRYGRFKITRGSHAIYLVMICIITPLAGGGYLVLSQNTNTNPEILSSFPGAEALNTPNYDAVENYNAETYRPRPQYAKSDLREAYAMKCVTKFTSEDIQPCAFEGSKNEIHIGIIGDSHAGHWEPALVKACKSRKCRVTSITKGLCPLSEAKFLMKKTLNKSCANRYPKLIEYIQQANFDIIVTSQYRKYKIEGGNSRDSHYRKMTQGLIDTWEKLESKNTQLVVIADTPWLGKNLPKCMERTNSNLEECTVFSNENNPFKDPLIAAAKKNIKVKFVDMSPYICPENKCYPVIGNVLVWRDNNHLTRTYSESLSEILYSEIGLK